MDSSSTTVLNPTASIIPSVTITTSSTVASAENVIYTFNLEIPGFILSTSYLVVQLPDEITVFNTRTLETGCGRYGLSGFTNSTRLSCDYRDKNLTIKRGFGNGDTTDPVSMMFTLPGLRNPRSL